MYSLSEATINNDVHRAVYKADLRHITQKLVFQSLELKYDISLEKYKQHIYDRAVIEARERIGNSPKLQKLSMNSGRLYNNYSYSDVKNHFIPPSKTNLRKRFRNGPKTPPSPSPLSSPSTSDSDSHSFSDTSTSETDVSEEHEQPPKKKRRLLNNNHCMGRNGRTLTGHATQSKREADKTTIYEFSQPLKETMKRDRGCWKDVWDWIMCYADNNNLRIGTRKLRFDSILQKTFERNETSVSGLSRLIWKHLKGALELDENGNFKKLKYNLRSNKRQSTGLTRLCTITDALKDIIDYHSPLQRNIVIKKFWDYTQKNNLKMEGRLIKVDQKLKKIFPNEEYIHMYCVQKGLAMHMTSMTISDDAKYRKLHPLEFKESDINDVHLLLPNIVDDGSPHSNTTDLCSNLTDVQIKCESSDVPSFVFPVLPDINFEIPSVIFKNVGLNVVLTVDGEGKEIPIPKSMENGLLPGLDFEKSVGMKCLPIVDLK